MPTSGSTRAPGAPDTVHELSLDNRMYQKDRQLIRKIAIGILLFWTGVIAFSLYSNVSLHYDQAHRHAKQKAVDHFNKEMAFRLWATGKGGFYLPVGDRTAPVHYLDFLEERDVFTEDDRILTLYDPVTALRQIVATHGDIYGLAGRLVGENPINPEATPDPWEQLALRAFQGGVREVFEIAEKDGEAFVRIMRPMPTRPGCLKCHGHLGHKAGEIRAGVSMAVPLREFTDDARSAAVTSAFSHGGLWLLGLLGIALTLQRIYRQMRERHVHMAEMELSEKVFAEGMQGILITDANGIILRVNQMFTSITGYPAEQVIGRRPSLLKSHHHHESFYQELWQSLLQRKFWVGEIWNRHQDGHYYLLKETISTVTDEHGDTRFYISMFQDITEEHQSRERIFQLAHYDTLTRLPNRELFLDRARQALEKARRYGKPLAVLFLDLDNFKQINDTMGHYAGDHLLKQVSLRMQSCLRASDTLARLSGDEFAILLEDYPRIGVVKAIAGKIIESLEEPIRIEDRDWYMGVSIGISLYEGQDADISELLKNADTAMYRAKEEGKQRFVLFDQDMAQQSNMRIETLANLRVAIRDSQFEFHYQPILDLLDRRIVGVEALLRWNRDGQLVYPDQFIPLAEESGLIVAIGQQMLIRACQQISELERRGLRAIRLFYNISSVELMQADFIDRIQYALQNSGLHPEQLELEITETTMMAELEQIEDTLRILRTLGVSLAIDDFGTGYSSLSYLKQLPIEVLKIDRSFIRDIPVNKEDASIVRTVLSMAGTLGLKVVSEGVENPQQMEFLEQLGCHLAQGYHISRPLGYGALLDFINAWDDGAERSGSSDD